MNLNRLVGLVTCIALGAPGVAGAQPTKPLTPADKVSPQLLVTRIDANCAVVKAATRTTRPSEVVLSESTTWKAVSLANATTAETGRPHVTFARIWKQAGNYVWVHWTAYDGHNNKHVDQLCFRNDGTLARVRQATTVPALDSAVGREAYYNRDGSLIKKTVAYDINDPVVYKHVRDLPFFSALP